MNTLNPITSSQNEQITKLTKLLRQKKERERQQLMVLEGIHLVTAYVEQEKNNPITLFIHEEKVTHPEIQSLLSNHHFTKCHLISTNAFGRIKENSSVQDILAIAPLPSQRTPSYQESCILLESIQDTGNVGTILRSAAASGIQNVILNPYCADVYSPKVLRAAMGAHFLLNISTDINLTNFLKNYKGIGLATALTPNTQSLFQTDLTKNTALIMGNEGAGVSQELQEQADLCIHIPMLGQVESLNVAMAATICLFEKMRQIIQKGQKIS